MQWSPEDSERYAWLPERLPEPGTTAEWTAAGGFLDIRQKHDPNNQNSEEVIHKGGYVVLFLG